MAHCVKVVLDDACAKNLQQEEALHSLGHTTITLSPTAANIHLREDSFNTCSDRETPKMVAKVLADFDNDERQCVCQHCLAESFSF